jgi:hypothetical protein
MLAPILSSNITLSPINSSSQSSYQPIRYACLYNETNISRFGVANYDHLQCISAPASKETALLLPGRIIHRRLLIFTEATMAFWQAIKHYHYAHGGDDSLHLVTEVVTSDKWALDYRRSGSPQTTYVVIEDINHIAIRHTSSTLITSSASPYCGGHFTLFERHISATRTPVTRFRALSIRAFRYSL